uniref:Uncharacterized protein n=1 Tax=viral metagenome TaxID=1070528 RepID=A0A6C0C7P5_9ZZZZ
MFTKEQVKKVSKEVLKDNTGFKGFSIVRLIDFLKISGENIDEVMCLKHRNTSTPYEILCLIDFRDNVSHTMSNERRRKLNRAGGAKRRKIKEKYHYDNVFNRIHGYIILEEKKGYKDIPRNKTVVSLSLICSSYYSNKKGVGTILMESMIKLVKKSFYFTDIVLEVSNEYAGTEESDEEYDESDDEEYEEYEEYDSGDESDEISIQIETVNGGLIQKISREFSRKIVRMNDGIAYYNICDDYINDIIYSYIEDEGYGEDEEESCGKEIIEEKTEKYIEEHGYGGYWYNKGKQSQIGLYKFYEKFGFVEDGRINYEWKVFTTNPFPSMVFEL